ncbi:tRNA (guanine(37)-N1)-methyltransferase [Toxorhynchites rutilus septentrionalis]|uniref:tRNA (guanine(37)-N1)-methyltransferase n=1 Tax=Toxorhynchites rutilus septentrionalis TaxID=329112 RepID=UPI002478BD5A|nr:tRNA (guanine(37)-N1)-methyltransferase [Toxorhynchites rutilus septentrionalis]
MLLKQLRCSIPLQTFAARRLRHYFRNMDCPDLRPPTCVRGMKVLDRNAFNMHITVPQLVVPSSLNFNGICAAVKKVLLKMERYKPVESNGSSITLHPLAVRKWEDLESFNLGEKGLDQSNLLWREIAIGYENWKYDEILKAILPEEQEGLSAFSKVGHIVHLNLKEHLLPYKMLIGDVIKDKIPGCKTVVNKLLTIDNTFRNFQMELLAGEEDYQVLVKENGVSYEFDFSKVYWNPRLSTEHEKIVKMLNKNDILFDIYAGVGPFSVPAAKKGCTVFANDLNPHSFKALTHNCKKNKVESRVKCFNKNGINFIQEEVCASLISINKDENFNGTVHITMNLPALAVEHLNTYIGLLSEKLSKISHFPLIHVYCFAKGTEDKKQIAREAVEQHMSIPLGENLKEISFVRNVSPNKDMMRVTFYLTEEILLSNTAGLKRPIIQDCQQSALKMGKNNKKNRNQQKQVAKKAKNVFAVSQAKKNNVKKAKEITSKLKKINVKDKREAADKSFQELHAHIVSKKSSKKPAPKGLPQKKKPNANTAQVEKDLDKMQV